MITGLEPAAKLNTATGTDTSGVKAPALGKEDFLALLIAQLEAQDPLSPMESVEFTAQLAQFSSLEQLNNVNDNLETLTEFEQALSNSSMINLIGKEIDLEGNTIDHETGETNNLRYSLEKSPASVTIEIFDSNGKLVKSINDDTAREGLNEFVWDGMDKDGKALEDGVYTFSVTALDDNDLFIDTETFTTGTVDEVEFEDSEAYAIVNGQRIEAGKITRVSRS